MRSNLIIHLQNIIIHKKKKKYESFDLDLVAVSVGVFEAWI